MEACRQLPVQPGKFWVWSIPAALGLAILIAVVSIRSGPSVQHAALAIHRAQDHVSVACGTYTGVKPPALQNVEGELSLAHAALAERRYGAAIAAAIKASQLAEHCNPKSPSLGS
jgi:hypothetical protein